MIRTCFCKSTSIPAPTGTTKTIINGNNNTTITGSHRRSGHSRSSGSDIGTAHSLIGAGSGSVAPCRNNQTTRVYDIFKKKKKEN